MGRFPFRNLLSFDSHCGTWIPKPHRASVALVQSAYERDRIGNRKRERKSKGVAGSSLSLRPGGRSPGQLRPLTLTPGYVQTAEGSVLVSLGNTRVLTNATIEQGVPGWLRNSGRGWVTAEYAMLPRSTVTRTPRESERGKIGGRTHEIQRLIGRSLRSVVDMQALGERTVILDCDVIQADGGTRTAAITGAAVALGLALNALVKAGTLKHFATEATGGRDVGGDRGWRDAARSLLRRGLAGRGGHERGDDRRRGPGGDAGDSGERFFFARAAEWADRSGRGGVEGDLCRAENGARRQPVAFSLWAAHENCCIGRARQRIISCERSGEQFSAEIE